MTQLEVMPTTTDDEDHERLTHIVVEGVWHEGNLLPLGNSVVEGMVSGTPVVALCGKTWVPGADPTKYPLCLTCREIAQANGWALPTG